MIVRTIILDDCEGSRIAAREALREFPDFKVIAEFSSSAEMFGFLKDNSADFLLLDIELDKETGFNIADKLNKEYPGMPFAFLTGHSSYAIDGYDFHPVNFLTKPINRNKLSATLETCK